LLTTAKELREMVMQVAKEKQQGIATNPDVWIPTLALLCGHILDHMSVHIVTSVTMPQQQNSYSGGPNPEAFASQERANICWALATAQRGSQEVLDVLTNGMVDDVEQRQQKQDQDNKSDQNNPNNGAAQKQRDDVLRPQEWSISLWAFATAQVYSSSGQRRLLQFVAQAMEDQPGFLQQFKPQELSNTVRSNWVDFSCNCSFC